MLNKTLKSLSLCSIVAIGLVGCATMHKLHDKIAELQMQKKHLADGSTIYVDSNVIPTAAWGCETIEGPRPYNWAILKFKGQFHLSGPAGMLSEKAIDYANQTDLKANYINLQLPNEHTFTRAHGRESTSYDLTPNAKAYVTYYQCQHINPNHEVGMRKKTDVSVSVGKAE